MITNLAPREVAYYYVDIPSNQPSWKVKLQNTAGDGSVYIRKGLIPTTGYNYTGPGYSAATDIAWLKRVGDENYILMPDHPQTLLGAGRYYLMVASEGINPSAGRIGTGTSGMVLHSVGNAPVTDLGTLPLAGSVEQADGFEGGENKLYTFTVPTGVLALEMASESVGSPKMAVTKRRAVADDPEPMGQCDLRDERLRQCHLQQLLAHHDLQSRAGNLQATHRGSQRPATGSRQLYPEH